MQAGGGLASMSNASADRAVRAVLPVSSAALLLFPPPESVTPFDPNP